MSIFLCEKQIQCEESNKTMRFNYLLKSNVFKSIYNNYNLPKIYHTNLIKYIKVSKDID